jgi:hypothetical protein
MICKKCGERSDQAAPQCVEISASGVRFVEHAWEGGSGRAVTEQSPQGRSGSMRSLLGERRSRPQPAPQPAAPQIPGLRGGMAEYLKLSGITGQDPVRAPEPRSNMRFEISSPNNDPRIRDNFLREDMPQVPGDFVREDQPPPPTAKVERTGPWSHAEILRECAPYCRNAGPGLLMGKTNPGRMVRGGPIRVEYKK